MNRGWKRCLSRATLVIVGALMAMLTVTACATESAPADAEPVPSAASPRAAESTGTETLQGAVEGAVVRFTAGRTSIDVTLAVENPTNRDLLSMLPLTPSVKEKIAALPRDLTTEGSRGSDPADGDLIYYLPWGSLGFYYDASGIGFSDQTIHIGTYEATASELIGLEGANVTVEVVG